MFHKTIRRKSKELKNGKLDWTEEHQAAYDLLERKNCNAPVLAFFEDSLDTAFHVDARDIACGAVLSEKHPPGWRPVSLCLRKFSSSERNLDTIKRQCLGIFYSTEKFWQYNLGRLVTVYTDHASTKWVMSLRTQNQNFQRRSLRLPELDLRIEHRRGTRNNNADALSRKLVLAAPSPHEKPVQFTVLRMVRIGMRSEQIADKILQNSNECAGNAKQTCARLTHATPPLPPPQQRGVVL